MVPSDTDVGPERPTGLWARILSAPRRLTLAARAALVLAFGLIVTVATAWLVFFWDPDSVPWRHAMSGWRIGLAVLLLFVIPVVAYWALRLWLQGERSRFPDIDYAWRAGLEALNAHGIPLDSAPVFLVLGAGGERRAQDLFEASGREFRVANVPDGPSPLRWYAAPDAVFICCTEAGWLSALATLRERQPPAESFPAAPLDVPHKPSTLTGTVPAPLPNADSPNTAVPSASPTKTLPAGTLMLDQFVASQKAGSDRPRPTAAAAVGDTAHVPDSIRDGPRPAVDEPLAVSSRDSAEQLERLQYVCRLLSQARQPLCAMNGLLTILPAGQLQASPPEVEELQRAIKADLQTVRETTQLRMPTIALVTGLDQDRGFRELVSRVGRQRAAAQRFGQKFDIRRYATEEDLGAFSAHVAGVFEDWIYALFREPGALTHRGNTHLYGLLCTVRCHWKTRLADILSPGFGYDPRRQSDDERHLFSGCYFAATGPTIDRQAFVKGVLDKLVEENDLVEWTDAALGRNRNLRRWSLAGSTLAVLLLAATLGVTLFRFLR